MRRGKILVVFLSVISITLAISSSWRPLVPAQLSTSVIHQEATIYGGAGHANYNLDDASLSEQLLTQQEQDTCALYKVSMNQQLYFEVNSCFLCLLYFYLDILSSFMSVGFYFCSFQSEIHDKTSIIKFS